MFTRDYTTPQKNNSEIVKQVLNTLINTTMRKKGEKIAVSILESLIKDIKTDFDFLKYIEIQDIRLEEEEERVIVSTSINEVIPIDVGKALYVLILKLSLSLEDKEGYFLIKEFQQRVGDEYFSSIKAIGIDTEQLLLEYYVAQERFKF